MGRQKYTNRDLAEDYFRVAAQQTAVLEVYSFQRRKISELEIDLPAFYHKHKSLKDIRVKGISPETKRILELILEKGVEKAVDIIYEEKIGRIKREQFKGIPSDGPGRTDDTPPSWDNIVRLLEDGYI